jgi:dihydroflavonol-4-reductase
MLGSMNVFLTGGTGLLGGAIARELLSRGHHVRALVRAATDPAALAGSGVEIARGDVLDAPAVRAGLAGCDAVVHTAGIARIGAPAETLAVNVRGTEVVLEAAAQAGVARAVFTSSTSVMGGTRAPVVLDEATPGNAEALGIGYFLSKFRAERTALDLARRGLPLVVVRPSFVLGPGDTHGSSASLVVALARRRVPAYVDGGASFCDVRDVAAGHVTALERGRPGEVYVLGGHNLTIAEMVARTCRLAGVRPPPRAPTAAAWAFAAAQEAWARISGRRPATRRELVRAAALYTFASSARAEAELGYRIRPFDEMVRDTLRFALEVGQLRPETAELREIAR